MFFTLELFLLSYLLVPLTYVAYVFVVKFWPDTRQSRYYEPPNYAAKRKAFFDTLSGTPVAIVLLPALLANPLIFLFSLASAFFLIASIVTAFKLLWAVYGKRMRFSFSDLVKTFKKGK